MGITITAAKKYFSFGWNCFPTKGNNKYPSAIKGWRVKDNQDPNQIFTYDPKAGVISDGNEKVNPSMIQCIYGWKDSKDMPVQMTIDTFKANYTEGGGIWASGSRMGNLDFDTKNEMNKSDGFYFEFLEAVRISELDVFNRIGVQKTPSGGYHWIFSIDFDNHIKESSLARSVENKVIIETRGAEQGIMLYPTKGYELVRSQNGIGFGFNYKEPITKEEFDELCAIAKSLCRAPKPMTTERKKPRPKRQFEEANIFDEFNEQNDILALLEARGYTVTSTRGRGIRVRSPETSAKDSGTVMQDDQVYFNHSESTMGGVKYATSAAIVCYYDYDNDWKAFAAELRKDKVYDESAYLETTEKKSIFIQWLESIFDAELVAKVCQEYFIGGNGADTVYWQMNTEKEIINSSTVSYEWHERRKRYIRVGRKFKGTAKEKHGFCCFGEHLIKRDKPVALFQYEEDAVFYRLKFLSEGKDIICLALCIDGRASKSIIDGLKKAHSITFLPNIVNGKFVEDSLGNINEAYLNVKTSRYVPADQAICDMTPIDKAMDTYLIKANSNEFKQIFT